MFQARRFREAGNGTVVFEDEWLGRRIRDLEWEEIWDGMVGEDGNVE